MLSLLAQILNLRTCVSVAVFLVYDIGIFLPLKCCPKDQALNKNWILSNVVWLKHIDNILQSLVLKDFSVEEWFY